jgi:hypothetical protein
MHVWEQPLLQVEVRDCLIVNFRRNIMDEEDIEVVE